MNDTLERLFWQRTDCELTLNGGRELEALLAEGGSAAQGRELERMARLLTRARSEEMEAPAELRQQVMSQVRLRSAAARQSRVSSTSKSKRGGWVTGSFALGDAIKKESLMSRKRLALLTAAAVVVVGGIAFLVLSDNFPPGSKTTGAIGGVEKAQHYRDTQVTKEDVAVEGVGDATEVDKDVLGDSTDKAIALSNDDKGIALSNDDKGIALSNDDKGIALSNDDKGIALSNDDKGIALSNDDKGIALSNDDKGIALSNDDKGIAAAKDNKGVAAAKDDKGIALAKDNKGIAAAKDNKGLSSNDAGAAAVTDN